MDVPSETPIMPSSQMPAKGLKFPPCRRTEESCAAPANTPRPKRRAQGEHQQQRRPLRTTASPQTFPRQSPRHPGSPLHVNHQKNSRFFTQTNKNVTLFQRERPHTGQGLCTSRITRFSTGDGRPGSRSLCTRSVRYVPAPTRNIRLVIIGRIEVSPSIPSLCRTASRSHRLS